MQEYQTERRSEKTRTSSNEDKDIKGKEDKSIKAEVREKKKKKKKRILQLKKKKKKHEDERREGVEERQLKKS